MNETMLTIKAAVVGFFSLFGTFLGWKGVMFGFWVVAMAIDWLTGSYAARKSGEWDSSVAKTGAKNKVAAIVVVVVAGMADIIIALIGEHIPLGFSWPGFLFPLVLAWYLVSEFGSILENAIKMGANVPSWLAKGLKISLKAIEEVGEAAVDGLEHAENMVEIADTGEKEE